jgi:hypothetical protein
MAPLTCDMGDTSHWLDRMHESLSSAVCSSARWFDSFFGTPSDYDAYRSSYGAVALGALWDERDGVEPQLRFKARLRLPQLSERFHAFIGRGDEDEIITGSSEQFNALPRQFRQVKDDEFLLAIGYERPSWNGFFDVDAGMRVDIPIDPYLRANYRIIRALGKRTAARFRQSAFVGAQDGLGTASKLDIDWALREGRLIRWTAFGKLAQRTEGIEWYSELTFFHGLGPRQALAYQLGVEGETGRMVGINDYGMRVFYRRQLLRDWLVLELRTLIDWPRDWHAEQREFNWGAGAAFEMRFGDWPS